MKRIIIILLIFLVFCLCATAGYQLANRAGPVVKSTTTAQQPTAEILSGVGGEQHNAVIVQVDQLDSQQPRLESVWFVSVFFMNDVPPTLTFVQLFSPKANSEKSRALAETFSVNSGGELASVFWDAVNAFDIPYEGFFLIDRFSTQYILEWANGPGEYPGQMLTKDGPSGLINQTCQSIGGMSLRDTPPFDWTGVAPKHFRSNIRMGKATEYWSKMTSSTNALRCDLILTP